MHIEDLGKVIADRRGLLGLDQRSLAELAGVSTRVLSAIETGGANPTLATVTAVLTCLGLRLSLEIGHAGVSVEASGSTTLRAPTPASEHADGAVGGNGRA